jgi:hypothetical protein
VSAPGEKSERVDIEKRPDIVVPQPGSNGTHKVPEPPKPVAAPRSGRFGPYHVQTIDRIPYKNEDVSPLHDLNLSE